MSTPVMQSAETREFDIAWVRDQFPSLKLQVNGQAAAFLDGPAGTQVPQQVMDAGQNYFVTENANNYGGVLTSRWANRIILSGRAAVADFVDAGVDEIGF